MLPGMVLQAASHKTLRLNLRRISLLMPVGCRHDYDTTTRRICQEAFSFCPSLPHHVIAPKQGHRLLWGNLAGQNQRHGLDNVLVRGGDAIAADGQPPPVVFHLVYAAGVVICADPLGSYL